MQIKVSVGTTRDAKVDVLAVPVFKIGGDKKQLPNSLTALDKNVGGALSQVVGVGDFRGSKGESQIVYPAKPGKAKRILLLGLGDPKELDTERLRELGGRCLRGAREKQAKSVALLTPTAKGVPVGDACQAIAEGAILGGYRFDSYLTKDGKKKPRRAS